MMRRAAYWCVFFFKGNGAPRDLPSSPTRRSPDLGVEHRQVEPRVVRHVSGAPDHDARVHDPVSARREPAARAVDACRSEEHTSELQSRQYLVCRLLLEKKKN